MADLTHAKLAHAKLAGTEGLQLTDPALAARAILAGAYAMLATADALDRIATVLERQDAPPEYVDPT